MLEFKPLTLDDLDLIRPYIQAARTRSCDDTVTDMMMWRDYFHKSYCIDHDQLFIKMRYFKQAQAFMLPYGGKLSDGLDQITAWCQAAGCLPAFAAVTDEGLSQLQAYYSKVSSQTSLGLADYIYDAQEFIQLQGKKYSTPRNHINRFIRDYPDFTFEPLTAADVPEVKAFFAEFNQDYNKDLPMVEEEARKIEEILDHPARYQLPAAVLRYGKAVLGFTIGEIVGDTLFVHVEKANTNLPGVYPVMSHEFALQQVTDAVKFINREEDMDDPGLRRSKEGYNPVLMLAKHAVTVEQL
ncbi:MAG: phosphatidylglycerol lysyltransferase domain-containing protein [Oscillospiraceae bacterium]|nr:phosphatidylglycerol lysyltransferase domain-containing protein [Oscillospiraceae bacterium]MDD4369028.1 phosphatidylglycerol lysyltransferase domain-containing protein [Oscillospiraceae bacterium]